MDTLGLTLQVRIGGAYNDPGVTRLLHVESHEVTAIPCENCPTIGGDNSEYLGISGALIRPSRLACCHGVVPEPT